jgi:hypothetical protein
MLRLGGWTTGDQRGVGPVPPLHDPHMHLGRTGDHTVERSLRHLAQATAARRLAMRDETGGRARGIEDPDRGGSRRCKLDNQGERELRGN